MPWELSFLDFIQENLRCGFLDVFMPALTRLGDGGVFWIVLSLALLLFPKTRRTGAIVTMALLLEFLCCNLLLKPLVARIRPYDVNPSVVLLVQRLADFSFPSGHTWAQNSRGFPTQGKTSGHCFPAESSFVSHFCNKNIKRARLGATPVKKLTPVGKKLLFSGYSFIINSSANRN